MTCIQLIYTTTTTCEKPVTVTGMFRGQVKCDLRNCEWVFSELKCEPGLVILCHGGQLFLIFALAFNCF